MYSRPADRRAAAATSAGRVTEWQTLQVPKGDEMNKTYALLISDANETLARVDGDIDVIAYVARKVNLDDARTYSVEFTETEGIGTDVDSRDVLKVTADGELVSLLLGKRIRSERKASAEAEMTSPAGEQPEIPAEAQELVNA